MTINEYAGRNFRSQTRAAIKIKLKTSRELTLIFGIIEKPLSEIIIVK
jgi:hypothetical protein